MQWRRRNCCTHSVKLLYLLSLLGLAVFLVQHVWQPTFALRPWWRAASPVVYRGSYLHTAKNTRNVSSQHSSWRFVIVPLPTLDPSTNISSVSNPPESPRSEAGQPPGPFNYIINEPDKCAKSGPGPFLVLLVATEARQVEARSAIRQTWGNESAVSAPGLVRLFLLGRTDGELGALQQKMLQAESKKHRDIIQQDFADTYKNLTYKTLMGMNWVAAHCPRASYVMKTDSDMFVNTEYLVYKLLRPDVKPKTNYFTGNNMRGFAPNRNKNSKWYMPPELYPNEKYPTFCSGTGYVFSGDLAGKIYEASQHIPHLHLEDVFVGICLAQLRIEPVPPPNAFLFNHWRVSYSSCKYSHLITSHGFHPNEILKYWHHLQSNKRNACINSVMTKVGRSHVSRMKRERSAG